MSRAGTHRCNFVSHICRTTLTARDSFCDICAMNKVSAQSGLANWRAEAALCSCRPDPC